MKTVARLIALSVLCCVAPLSVMATPAAETGDRLDLNQATIEELVELPKIGPALAARVVEYREQHGGFRSVDELMSVRGIGQKVFDQLRDRVTVGEPAAPAADGDPS